MKEKKLQQGKVLDNNPSYFNHQLKVDPIEVKRTENIHLKEIDVNIQSNNEENKEPVKAIFVPPKDIQPVDEIPIDTAEDESPVDESTQTDFTQIEIPHSHSQEEEEEGTGEVIPPPPPLPPLPPIQPVDSLPTPETGSESGPIIGAPKPEPKLKPTPKEKPAPGNSVGQTPPLPPSPPSLGAKPKPTPRSLLSLLGFEDGPKDSNINTKPKPGPKGKPTPIVPVLGRNIPQQPVVPGKLPPTVPPVPPTITTPAAPATTTNTQQNIFPFLDETMPFVPTFRANENTRLHAQMNLLSSPHSLDYSDEAYIKIQAIQDYCSIDYATFCNSMMVDNMLNSPMFPASGVNIMPFGNWDNDDDQATNENSVFVVGFMNSIFDVFSSFLGTSEDSSANAFITIDIINADSEDELLSKPPPCSRGIVPPPPPPTSSSSSSETVPVPDILPQIDPIFIEPRNRLLHGFHHSHDSHDSHDSERFENPISDKEHRQFHPSRPRGEGKPRPEDKPRPGDIRGSPHPPHSFFGKHMEGSSSSSNSNSNSGSNSGSVSSSSNSESGDNFFFFRPPPPPPLSLREFPRTFDDMPVTFLGYGTEGDMCLMSKYNSLSSPCQNAIDDAFVLHDQYTIEEESGQGCAFAAGMAGMLLVLATFVCCKRYHMKPRREKIMKTLKAIHNDPELKSRIEAATGVSVPEPCQMHNASNQNQPCRAKQCLMVVLRLIVTFALSLLLVRVAAEGTVAIANNMIYTNENNETVEPSPVVVLLIFISFLLAQLLVVVGIKKCIMSYRLRRQRESFANSGTNNSNTPPPTTSSSTTTTSNGGFGRYFVFPTIPLPTRKFSLFRSNSSNGYSPLMTDEENTVTEMVQSPSVVVASAPLQHQVLYVPPSTVQVHPHVTAQSLSSVSMI